MNKWIFLVFILFTGVLYAETDSNTFLIPSKSQIVFLEKAPATDVLKGRDEFIKSLSIFDRSSRLKTNQIVSNEDFINKISFETLDWDTTEIKKVKKIISSIQLKFSNLNLYFPEKVFLIKTTGKEEGNAAYCRGNSIILPQKFVNENSVKLENDMIHELFHIYSKNNPDKKDPLYNLIGFYKCPELELPEELKDIKITNPDAYLNNYYITIVNQSKTIKVIPVLFANRKYDAIDGKDSFEYMRFALLEVEINNDKCMPIYFNNHLSLISPNQSYLEQTGFNTKYIIHPEEILADNFVLLINQDKNIKSVFVIEGMKKILNNK